MLPVLCRGPLGALIVLVPIQPVIAWNWYVIDESWCCEEAWDCCEAEFVIDSERCGCEADPVVIDGGDCNCGIGASAESEPTQRQSDKTESATTETPQPALNPEEELPPAPINVPARPPVAEPESRELFPGPAAEPAVPAETEPSAVTPTRPAPTDIVPPSTSDTESESQPGDSAGGLFDEPAAEVTAPAAAPAESSPVDDVFGEPTPPADGSTDNAPAVEEESVEVESTETETPESESTEQPATDPLDDLFGPSSAIERPELKHDAVADGDEFRQWSSRNGNFQCQGRLIRMTTDGVLVVQPGGEVFAIGYSQLSDTDLMFVRGQVRAQLAQQAIQAQVVSH